MFYIPIKEKTLLKHKIYLKEKDVGSLGPIMVSPDYIGNGYQNQMMSVLEEYMKNINKKYIFKKVTFSDYIDIMNIEKGV